MRVPYRDPRRGGRTIGRTARPRELTPEEQILALHGVIGNAAVTDLLGQGTATGGADAKAAECAEDAGGAADGKGGGSADLKAAAEAGAKGGGSADSKFAEYGAADAKFAPDPDSKAAAEAGAKGGGASGQDPMASPSTYEIDWLYEMRSRKPRW